MERLSRVTPYREYDSSCGYCNSDKGRVSYGMDATRLTCVDYQAMIDRGWRRSGTFCYLPTNFKACCPNYTIRLDVHKFKATKKQRKVTRKLERVIAGKAPLQELSHSGSAGGAGGGPAASVVSGSAAPPPPPPGAARASKTMGGDKAGKRKADSASQPTYLHEVARQVLTSVSNAVEAGSLPPELDGFDDSKIRVTRRRNGLPHELCTAIALALAAMHKRASPADSMDAAAVGAIVAEQISADWRGLLTATVAGNGFVDITMVNAERARSEAAEFASRASAARAAAMSPTEPEFPRHTYRVDMVPARFEEESFALYKRYQMAVHGDSEDKLTKEQYVGFLVESPLIPEPFGGPPSESDDTMADGDDGDVDAAAVARLCSLGFPESLVIEALRRAGGDMNAAAHQLIGGGDTRDALQAAQSRVLAAWRDGEGSGAALSLVADMTGSSADTPSGGGGGAAPDSNKSASRGDSVSSQTRRGRQGALGYTVALGGPDAGADMGGGYGSFHQRYYIDERLVAVGVVDILPQCLSSVYVFYDPDLPALELGKFSALREIEWVKQAAKVSPRLHYYYMGYYIHTCVKMRYKGDYEPSDLLCPVSLRWVPLDRLRARLDRERYFEFAERTEEEAATEAARFEADVRAARNDLLMVLDDDDRLLQWDMLNERGRRALDKHVGRYTELVGPDLARRMLMVIR